MCSQQALYGMGGTLNYQLKIGALSTAGTLKGELTIGTLCAVANALPCHIHLPVCL